MKRIEFIEPISAMRGNLCETQKDIVYPSNDNRAYDGPDGELNTARNYQPIIVGAKRANGKTYFCVKTKTTNHLTPKAKKAMATMGATCAVYSAMSKDSAIAAKMDEVFAFILPSLPPGTTPRSYFMERIKLALSDKDVLIDLSAGSIDFKVRNPWIYNDQFEEGFLVIVKTEILVKFWSKLAINPITFTVNGQKGIAHSGDDFDAIVNGTGISLYNVLGLSIRGSYVKLGSLFVITAAGVYVRDATRPTDGAEYILTNVEPE